MTYGHFEKADGTDILVHIPRVNSSGKIIFSLLLPIRLTLVKLFNLNETRKYSRHRDGMLREK